MTLRFGPCLFVIPNSFRDLGFGFRIYVLKPRPVGRVLDYRNKLEENIVKFQIRKKEVVFRSSKNKSQLQCYLSILQSCVSGGILRKFIITLQ